MKTKLTAIAVASLIWACATSAETNTTAKTISPDRVSLYEVPLVCPAAPQIGCGSRSKPILLKLEREASVAEAWLNRAGTVMAVVWKPEAKRKERSATIKAACKKEDLTARALRGTERKKVLKDFLSGEAWLRGRDWIASVKKKPGLLRRDWCAGFRPRFRYPRKRPKRSKLSLPEFSSRASRAPQTTKSQIWKHACSECSGLIWTKRMWSF